MRRGFFRWGGKIFRRAPRAKTPPHLDGALPHLNFPPASPPAPPGRFAAEIPASSNFFPRSGPGYTNSQILQAYFIGAKNIIPFNFIESKVKG